MPRLPQLIHLRNNKKFSKQEIAKRSKIFLLIQKKDKAIIFSGDKAINRFKREVNDKKINKITEIQGMAAAPGFAKGKVKIVFGNINDNDI